MGSNFKVNGLGPFAFFWIPVSGVG